MPEWIKQIADKCKNTKKRSWIILGAAVLVLFLLAVILVWNSGRDKELTEMTDFTYDLKSSDADSLLAGKFSGRGYTFTLQEDATPVGDVADSPEYFVYRVADAGGELGQGLAVDKVSGEIYGYDFSTGTITDFTQSMFYEEEKDKVYSWDGTYENKETKTQVTMAPEDANTFELTITVDGAEKLFGSATATGDTAQYEGEGFAFTIQMLDGEIQITDTKGDSKFSGTYSLK